MARVNLEGVSKVYPGGVAAVESLDLDVRDREFVVLVGPSGCGKSTTLRMIAGLEDATDGVIRIGDRVVNDVSPKDRNIAMVFQNYALYPHMTVYKNMAFGLELRYGGGIIARLLRRLVRPAQAAEMAVRRRGIRDQVRQTAQMLGIESLLQRMPRQLSGGERQRVALGRAIVRKPAVFLFDEPLSNLDAKLRVEMRRELKRLHQQLEATMIYVTHDQVEALTLGDRIAVMDRGRIQQLGAPLEVYDRPASRSVAALIGTPPMNFVDGRLDNQDGKLCFVSERLTASFEHHEIEERGIGKISGYVGRKIVLGVRPEDVTAAAVSGSAGERGSVALVVGVESLGDSTLLHLGAADTNRERPPAETDRAKPALVSKTSGRTGVKLGDAVNVTIRTARAHFFDPVTGENLT